MWHFYVGTRMDRFNGKSLAYPIKNFQLKKKLHFQFKNLNRTNQGLTLLLGHYTKNLLE